EVVVGEFRKFLRCGVLAHGFARVRCGHRAFECLVPFSCKGRAVCPSCGGWRMAERAAHLVDRVLPADVPVRQWVLSVPHRLRYRLAYDHRLCRTVLHVSVRALRSAYRRQARRQGLAGGETGMVTSVQRFGGAVNVHLHFHTHVLDGVFVRDGDGTLRFRQASPPTDEDVHVAAGDREWLERLCQYLCRPPLGQGRLHRLRDGRIAVALQRPWADGTTHLVFTPVELLERLVPLVPRPRTNLILYITASWRR